MNDASGGRRTSIQNEVYQNFASNKREDGPQTPSINIVVLKSIKDEKFVLRVLPLDLEITRTLQDIYTLRANLCVEFPYYYVPSADPSRRLGRQQGQFHPELLLAAPRHADHPRVHLDPHFHRRRGVQKGLQKRTKVHRPGRCLIRCSRK